MGQAVRSDRDVSALAAQGRERRRRRRVAQTVVTLVLAAAALFVVVIWQRNSVRLTEATERFEKYLPGLRQTLRASGTLPLVYPPRQPGEATPSAAGFTYIDTVMVRHLRASTDPMIVAYSPAVRLIMGPDERVVAIRDGTHIRVTVMRADRFAHRLAEQKRRMQVSLDAVREAGPKLP